MSKATFKAGALFNMMQQSRWTRKAIGNFFNVPSAISRHIQSTFCSEQQAWEITKAHKELCNGQVGF